ncbi:MAG: DNA primase [Gemmatimonadetes bacterium]|nr:DNA primase [Gemmatimonadota bacterium]
MSMIPDEVIEQVRDSADLLAVIGESVELKRSGSDWRGPCPFHGGQHRNFAVIPKKGRYYCFVCKESGDVFSWYMKRLGMDYPTAVREVARKTGIVIPESSARQGPDPREPLFQAVAVAHDWFARQLTESAEAEDARRYLVGRGLDLETLGPQELGYAPRGAAFQTAMTQLGLDPKLLLEAGLLAQREDGTIIPRFRGRLLFPIHDLRGRVVGFGGRLLGPGEPKYLNSPESPVFHKGGTLYNLHAAKNTIRKEGVVIIVEGYFDVLRLVLAGVEQVVAPLGTALTAEQAAILKRFAPQAILLLDSDTAGLKATFRAADELLRHEVRVRVATMPPGEDPDTLVQKGGAEALEPILRDAVDVMERKIQILDRRGWFTGIEHRREALDRLLPTIRATKDPIQRELYLSLVSERSGVGKPVLEHEVATHPEPAARVPESANRPIAQSSGRRPAEPARRAGARTEVQLLRLMIQTEEWRHRAHEELQPEWFESPGHRPLFEILLGLTEAGVAVPPEELSEPLRALWQRVAATDVPLDLTGQANLFAAGARKLEARPALRAWRQLNERIQAAEGAEKSALLAEKDRQTRALQQKYPEEFRTQGYQLGRRAARRPAPPG